MLIWLALLLVGAEALSTTTKTSAIGDLLRRTPGVSPDCAYDATPLQSGFCNDVFRVDVEHRPRPLVVKLFSDLARARCAPACRGVVDVAAGAAGLGPRVLVRTDDALVQEFSPGAELAAPAVRADGSRRAAAAIAPRLAALHALPCPGPLPAAPAALWVGVDAMLGDRGGATGGALDAGALAREARRMRAAVDGVARADVLGHGDFKPSNVLLHDGAAVFIDFELAGPNYRGYDIFKLFRTNEMAPASDDELLRFIAVYLAEGGAAGGDAEAARCLAESKLFEPLTWLEAAIFFEFAAARLPEKRDEMRDLARDRWAAYEAVAGADFDRSVADLRRLL